MHSPYKNIVVSDVDGVILDFYKGAKLVLEDMLGREIKKVDDRPATRFRYGLTMDEYQKMRVVMRTHKNGWSNLPVLDGAIGAIRKLQENGYEVVFLSSCGQSLYDLRRENLDKIGFDNCKLICVEDKDKNAKGIVLQNISPIAFIDDHMTMISQAPFVPNRVWIDHGCSLELDSDGIPFIEKHQVFRTPSISQWVDSFVESMQLLEDKTVNSTLKYHSIESYKSDICKIA